MNAPAMIGRLNADGTITATFLGDNRYPMMTGWLLGAHYTDPATIDALVGLGALAELGAAIGAPPDGADPDAEDADGFRRWCLLAAVPTPAAPVELATWPREAARLGCRHIFLWDGAAWLWATVMHPRTNPHAGPWYRLTVDPRQCEQVTNTPIAGPPRTPTSPAVTATQPPRGRTRAKCAA